jgi:VanZ family protein
MSRAWELWLPAVAQMAIIYGASSIPDLTTLPGGLSDHTGHSVGYALLAALVLRARAGGTWRGVTTRAGWQAWLVAVLYGATDEFHQSFVHGRSPDVHDWIADATGAGLAVFVAVVAAFGARLDGREV